MKKNAVVLLVVGFSFFGLNAQARETSWDYVSIGYISLSASGVTATGFGIGGSVEFTPNFFGEAGYISGSGGGIDVNGYVASLGGKMNTAPGTDVYGEINYVSSSAAGTTVTDTNFGVGARSKVTDTIQFDGGVIFGSGNVTFGVHGLFYFTDKLAGSIGITTASGSTGYTIGAQFDF